MRRSTSLSAVSVLAALLGLGQLVACDSDTVDESSSAQHAAGGKGAGKGKKHGPTCDLDDGSDGKPDAEPHACDPQNTKKTTICHIPPGNPGNAHTICVGNAAVDAHVRNHGDLLGPCQVEPPCPPPPTGGTGGSPETGGTGGSIDDHHGEGGSGGSAPTGATGGTGGTPVIL
jgi:hypothetical protein